MALFKCPECSNLVSDQATACPHCGFRLNQQQGHEVEYKTQESVHHPPKLPLMDFTTKTERTIMPVSHSTSSIILIVLSVLSCTLIPIIFGIITMVCDSNAKNSYLAGNIAQAQQQSEEASKWLKIGWIVLLVILSLGILSVIIFGLSFLAGIPFVAAILSTS